jgi:predicted nucleic acid-binding protein
MIAVDTNLLVYAHRTEMQSHAAAFEGVRALVVGSSTWALTLP